MELQETPNNPVPEGANAGFLIGFGGIRLRYCRWVPTGKRHKGTVCLFTGRGECIEKYFEVISELRSRGFTVATMDWRGQGGSDRLLPNARKGHVDNFDDYENDLNRFMDEVVLPDCPAPYYALAHSMGGSIILRSARRRDCWFERIVLSAPMIALANNFAQSSFTAYLSEVLAYCGFGESYVPGGGNTTSECAPFPGNKLTGDPNRHNRNCEIVTQEQQLGVGSPTIQWLYAAHLIIREMSQPDFPQSVHVPVLMVGAARDEVVASSATERLASELRSGSFHMIPGARHEILMERDAVRSQFWVAFDAFIPGTPLYS